MDEFEVRTKEIHRLAESHLVNELRDDATLLEQFPVLIGKNVCTFHDIEGGYAKDEGYHVVKLIHKVQGPSSPPSTVVSKDYELHLGEYSWHLEVEDVYSFGDYPSENYELCLKVTGYEREPYSFAEPLDEDVDERETEFDHE